jgi:hypothetical protein
MVFDFERPAIPVGGGAASHDEPKALNGVGEVTPHPHSYSYLFTPA